jgi:Putative restriction endonuclease
VPISEATYRRVALEDPDGNWELHGGRLRPRSSGTFGHNKVVSSLGFAVLDQLPRDRYDARMNAGRLRRSASDIYVPDFMVIPIELTRSYFDRPHDLEVYDAPVALVAEVCDAAIAEDAADDKLPGYRERGDREIWRLHPFERTLIVWRRQPGGNYEETTCLGGMVGIASLPGVTIDLDALFA